MTKLSTLSEETMIVSEEYGRISVEDMKNEILVYGRDCSKEKWFLPIDKNWKPSAQFMVQRYIDGEADEMYEDWDEKAARCFKQNDYDRIQAILNEVFARDNVIDYYEFGEQIEIDIMP